MFASPRRHSRRHPCRHLRCRGEVFTTGRTTTTPTSTRLKKDMDEFSRNFPTSTFRDCGSSSQYRSPLAERGVFFLKRYIKSSFDLKPNSPLPIFTSFVLTFGLLAVAKRVANSRPLTYLKQLCLLSLLLCTF